MSISWAKTISVVLVAFLLVLSGTSVPATGDSVQADGFLDNDNTTRVVDYRVATKTVPVGVEMEIRVVVANYGSTDKTITLDPEAFKINRSEGTYNGSADENMTVLPSESYTFTIGPGEYRVYSYLIRFDHKGDYAIRMTDGGSGPTELRYAEQNISVSPNGSAFDGSRFIDRAPLSRNFVGFDLFKDENSGVSDISSTTLDIPPVEVNEDDEIVRVDVAKGKVTSFQKMTENADTNGEITPSSGNILVGMAAKGVPADTHYSLRLSYKTDSSFSASKLDINIVDSFGREIDPQTDYRLDNTDSRKTLTIQLSAKEAQYVRSQNQLYVVFNGTGLSQGIEIYKQEVVSANELYNLPKEDLVADLTVSKDKAKVGDRIRITAKITNNGAKAVTRKFNLYEVGVRDGSSAIKVSEEVVVNPGSSNKVNFIYELKRPGDHKFKVLGATKTVKVADESTFGILPTIVANPETASTSQTVDFSITDVNESKIDNVEYFKWYFKDGEPPADVTINNPTSSSDATTSYSFSNEADPKTIYLEYKYSNGSKTETTTLSKNIQVIGPPNVRTNVRYFDFGLSSQLSDYNAAFSPLVGTMSASSCKTSCGGSFVFTTDYVVTRGINMLVLDVNQNGTGYQPEFYGTYIVGKSNGDYATTTNVTESGMDDIRAQLNSGTSGDPNQALINDIQDYRNDNKHRYFIFMSGGNPQPATYQSQVQSELSDLGANMNGSGTLGENSVWMFASQQIDSNTATPLFEKYVPGTADSPELSRRVELRPINVSDGANIPPRRTVYMDVSETELAGNLKPSNVNWVDRGDGSQDTGIYTSVVYTSTSSKRINVTVEDEFGASDNDLHNLTVNTVQPEPVIGQSDLTVDSSGFINSTSSADRDAAIQSYTWEIEDDGKNYTVTGQNPVYDWKTSGKHNVTLTVTGLYGNTNSTSGTVNVSTGPPEVNINTSRVPVRLERYNKSKYGLDDTPIVHLAFDDLKSGGVANDLAGIHGGEYIGSYPDNCKEIAENRENPSNGTYRIDPDNDGEPFKVYCDMVTDGGGWTGYNASSARASVNDVGGGLREFGDIQISGFDSGTGDPYSVDGSGDSAIRYDIGLGYNYDEFYLSEFVARSASYRVSSSQTSEFNIHGNSYTMTQWSDTNGGGCNGDLGFGSPNDAGPANSFANSGVTYEDNNGTVEYPHNGNISTVSTAQTFRMQFSESCGQQEGWEWESGRFFVRNGPPGTGSSSSDTTASVGKGVSNKALKLGNGTANVKIPHTRMLSQENLTITAWIYPQNVDDQHAIVGKRNAYSFKVRNGGLRFTTPGIKDYDTSNISGIREDEWTHVAVTFREGGKVRFYVDGNEVYNESAGNINFSDSPLRIGINQFGEDFHGRIDGFRMYDEVLTESDIEYIYTQNASYSSNNGSRNLIYGFGNQRFGIDTASSGKGSATETGSSIELDAVAKDTVRSTQVAVTEVIDLSQYDAIGVSYRLDAERSRTKGDIRTGKFTVQVGGNIEYYAADFKYKYDEDKTFQNDVYKWTSDTGGLHTRGNDTSGDTDGDGEIETNPSVLAPACNAGTNWNNNQPAESRYTDWIQNDNLEISPKDGTIYYEVRVVPFDSWDSETVEMTIEDDSGTTVVESATFQNEGRTGSDKKFSNACYRYKSDDAKVLSGTFNVDGNISRIRFSENATQNDEDESLGIDYIRIYDERPSGTTGTYVNKTIQSAVSDSRSGVVKLDVSNINGNKRIKMLSQAYGTNGGRAETNIYSVWVENNATQSTVTPAEFFDRNLYPSNVSKISIQEGRDGVVVGSKTLPAGSIVNMTVRNNNSRTLEDYQVKVTVQHRSGMSNDFSDIKFFNSEDQELDHWVESYDSGNQATVWVEVGSLPPNSNTTIKMLYDSPAYSNTSDGSATFPHFDEFNTQTSDNWEFGDVLVNRGSNGTRFNWDVLNSRVETDSTNSDFYNVKLSTRFDSKIESNGFVAEVRARTEDDDGIGIAAVPSSTSQYDLYGVVSSNGGSDTGEYIAGWQENSSSYSRTELVDFGEIYGGPTGSATPYTIVGMRYNGDSEIKATYNRSVQSVSYTESGVEIRELGLLSVANDPPAYYDWFLVRKYAEKQPTVINKTVRTRGDRGILTTVGNMSDHPPSEVEYGTRLGSEGSSGANVFVSQNSYNIGNNFGVTKSIYCDGISTIPTCSDNGTESGISTFSTDTYNMFGASASVTGDGTFRNLESEVEVNGGVEFPTVEFSASGTEAKGQDNSIQSYKWDLDGGAFDTDRTGKEITHTFKSAGQKEVALRVTDEYGTTNTTTKTVNIANTPPDIAVSGTDSLTVNETAFYSITTDDTDIREVTYIFSDGVVKTADPSSGVSRKFDSDGQYKVTVVAVDNYGLTDAQTVTTNVSSNPPNLDGLADNITTHVEDTLVLDSTGDVNSIGGVPPSITTIYDASDATNPNGGDLTFDWTLPSGEVKEGDVVDFVPSNLSYPAGCNDIAESRVSPPDGQYVIDPDGEGGVDPFRVDCEMTDNGGWVNLSTTRGENVIVTTNADSTGTPMYKGYKQIGGKNQVPDNDTYYDSCLDKYGTRDCGGKTQPITVRRTIDYYQPSNRSNVYTPAQERALAQRATALSNETSMVVKSFDDDDNRPCSNGHEVILGSHSGVEKCISLQATPDVSTYGTNKTIGGVSWDTQSAQYTDDTDDLAKVANLTNDTLPSEYILPEYIRIGHLNDGAEVGHATWGYEKDHILVRMAATNQQQQIAVEATNEIGQSTTKIVNLTTIDEGPVARNLTVKDLNTTNKFFLESSTCDNPGYCGSNITMNGEKWDYNQRGINMIVLNDNGQPVFFGGYDVHSGGDYVVADNFSENGEPSSITRTYCDGSPPEDDGTGCVTPALTNKIQQYNDEPGYSLIFVADDQPMPYGGQGRYEVTAEEQELYNTLQSMGATLNKSSSYSSDSYSKDFTTNTTGWQPNEGTLEIRSNTWVAPTCTSSATTSQIESTSMSVGQSGETNQIKYNIRAAAYDSWDDEELYLYMRYGGSWNNMGLVDPTGGSYDYEGDSGGQLHTYETFDNPPSRGALDCSSWSGDGPIDLINFTGTVSVSDKVTGVRLVMDPEPSDGAGNLEGNDNEGFAIDKVTIKQTEQAGLGYRDMWIFAATNNQSAGTPRGCAGIKTRNPDANSGVYEIDPDGSGGVAPFDVYCEMNENGGGWIKLRLDDDSVDKNSDNMFWFSKYDTVSSQANTHGDIGEQFDWSQLNQLSSQSQLNSEFTDDGTTYYPEMDNGVTNSNRKIKYEMASPTDLDYTDAQIRAIRQHIDKLSDTTNMFTHTNDDDNCDPNGEIYTRLSNGGSTFQMTPYTSGNQVTYSQYWDEEDFSNSSYLLPTYIDYGDYDTSGCSGSVDHMSWGWEKDYLLVKGDPETSTSTPVYEDWAADGSESGIGRINTTLNFTTSGIQDGDYINVSFENYHPHPRIGGRAIINVTDADGVYSSTIAEDDGAGHRFSVVHQVNLTEEQENSIPVKLNITGLAIDDYSKINETSKNITIGAIEPNANIYSNKSVATTGEDIKFNGSGSTDPQNSDLNYTWKMGDGTTKTGETVVHSYSTKGTKQVTLVVENKYGQKDNVTVNIEVADEPTADIEINVTDKANSIAELNATGSTADEQIEEYVFYPGDGSGPIRTTSATYTHDYPSSDSYTAEVKVIDNFGQEDNATDTEIVGYPKSCKEQKSANSSSTSGEYKIDPDQDGTAFSVYCDMNYDGGGWTVISLEDAVDFKNDVGGSLSWDNTGDNKGFDGYKPFSYDGGSDHYTLYTFKTGFTFDEYAVKNIEFKAMSDVADNYGGDTSETDHTEPATNWGTGNGGNVDWGTKNQVLDTYEDGDSINCRGCKDVWDSSDGKIYDYGTISSANSVRLGWGEQGPQHEGWKWHGGSIYVR